MRLSRKVLVRSLIVLLVLTPLAAWGVIGCRGNQPLHVRLDADVSVPQRCAVLFFADGLDQTKMRELLSQGRLPHIQRHFVEGGVEVRRAIAALPPTTYPNAVSLLTGLLPGHHGILGNQWYDRDTMLFFNYGSGETYRSVNEHFDALTIYDLLSDELTVNVQCHTRRGATFTIDNVNLSAIKWFLGWYEGYDRRVGISIEEVGQIANRQKRWPILTTLYFPGLDEVGHACGVDSRRYAGALRTVDAQIGRVISALERAGVAPHCYFVLVTDHGHVATTPERTFELIRWLRERRGLRVRDLLSHDEDELEPLERLQRVQAVALDGAFRRAVIHLPGPGGWRDWPTPEQVEQVLGFNDAPEQALHEQPGVGLVCIRGDGSNVRVISRRGQAVIERRVREGVAEYRIRSGSSAFSSGDPLDYRDDGACAAFVEAGWHSSREWLAATAHTRYPDFVPQILEMFESPRAGDIVVFADEGWTFRRGERGGHGSAASSDVCVSMFFSGPDLPRGASIPHGRLVDVMPTLLELLGRGDRLARAGQIDGESLAAELRQAGAGRP